ncbi:MAG: hypothetical protein LBJ01_00880 [Tannerella sp.]|jgi:hypothetical protein|nr:hypothetical protein [Tannerella sp.]
MVETAFKRRFAFAAAKIECFFKTAKYLTDFLFMAFKAGSGGGRRAMNNKTASVAAGMNPPAKPHHL